MTTGMSLNRTIRRSAQALALSLLAGVTCARGFAQDSVDVTFRYVNGGVSTVGLPGEFNGWNTNAWPMTNQGGGVWTLTARLRVGGKPGGGVPGGWQYKFFYNAGSWTNDPLNHHINAADNSNSVVYTRDPTIYQFLPNSRQGAVAASTPTISAYLFPKVGATVDSTTIQLTVDGVAQPDAGASFDRSANHLAYTLPVPIANGNHTAILSAMSSAGGSSADTVTFYTQAGYVQITTHGGFTTRAAQRPLNGVVQDTLLTSLRIVRNTTDTSTVPVTAGRFSSTVSLLEGLNTFKAVADSHGVAAVSTPVTFTRIVNHAPYAAAAASLSGGGVSLSADSSSDPEAQALSFTWLDDPSAPIGLNGAAGPVVAVAKPSAPGEYFYSLIARDPDNNADTLRSYFIINPDSSLSNPTIASNPSWAKNARIYFMFPKAASASGTINGAAARLPYIRDMGFSVVWLMPVMTNAYPINQGYGPGYNITDFYTVAPEYGTNQDFKNFVSQAHTLGLKVILDVTPNHTSRFHPWSADAHQFHQDSQFWTWYQHTIIPHNDNGLGQSLDADGFNYYSGFSDQLLNFNWTDVDARSEMINVYLTWIKQFGLDGYRFDVYWGPHRRYGEQYMGDPVRRALKHVKPDILLLGEDDGTGFGTEAIYADYASGDVHGGLDMAYDFKLYFNQIRNFGFSGPAINSLATEIDNGGFYPGPDALYMRFMESQDEDRIVYFYSSVDATTTFRRTMPMAGVVFTAPGVPMLWNGQEVGWGYGIPGAKEARNRSTINWEYQGKQLLSPHYQKLALLRGQFPAFSQHKKDTNADGSVTSADVADFVRTSSTNSIMYSFTRPYPNQNGWTVVNFSGADQSTTVNLTDAKVLLFDGGIQAGTTYYLNNLYDGTYQTAAGSALGSVDVSLPPYGTAVYTVSLTRDSLVVTNPILSVGVSGPAAPAVASLEQNYPNPFNPTTVIRYQLPALSGVEGPGASNVILKVYDVLGREIAVLVNEVQQPGLHQVTWNAAGLASGTYFYRLNAGSFTATKKLILLR
jgi:cyclomaltodextrinase